MDKFSEKNLYVFSQLVCNHSKMSKSNSKERESTTTRKRRLHYYFSFFAVKKNFGPNPLQLAFLHGRGHCACIQEFPQRESISLSLAAGSDRITLHQGNLVCVYSY